jgi:1-acyl-sn-glycerol-3-phosphate acyltransferase
VSGWLPRSSCGDHCLPEAAPTVGAVRSAARLLAAALVVVAGLGIALACPVLSRRARHRLVGGWFRSVLRAFGARLRVIGPPRFAPAGSGVLVVANHVSWLDTVALNAVLPSRMVAKTQVRDWPVIGLLAAAGGTIFIDRERLRSLPSTIERMAAALRSGECVTAFPEGTTTCGRRTGRYRRACFQAAVDAGADVRPVAVSYLLGGRATTATAFVGTGALWASLCRVAALRGLVIEVEVLPMLPIGLYPDRRALATAAQAATTPAHATKELSCTELDVAQWAV